MSVQKKSLIGDRTAVKKAIIASKPDTTPVGEPKTLKADALRGTVQHMKRMKRMKHLKVAF